MKIYMIIKNIKFENDPNKIDIKSIYGIYQKRSKSFWECKIANLNNNKDTLNKYIIVEIDLEKDIIVNTYKLFNTNNIIDLNKAKYRIPKY